MKVQPYLFYEGRCEEAITFYQQAIGAKLLMLMRNSESPEPTMAPPGAENKVLHASFSVGDNTLMASDGQCSGNAHFGGFGLALSAATEAEAKKLFEALSAGGQVRMPLTKTFFSPAFGMVADKFGVSWMVMADPQA